MKLDRLVIENIEGRILLGIVSFVSIMILIGWVAINEPARMASFEEQHTGRSIERGAELFAANCSTCHGANGYGIAGRAPGLNSPHLFGYDFLAEVNNQVARLQRQRQEFSDQIVALVGEEGDNGERAQLLTEIGEADDARRDEIVARIEEIDAAVTDLEAQIAQVDVDLEPLLADRDAQIAALDPALGLNYFPDLENIRAQVESGESEPIAITEYLALDANRLAQIEWGGDLRSYLTTTLVHGRPGSSDVWGGNAMVAWAQSGGGPLRPDQIDDLVNYILNWDRGDNWTEGDLFRVSQFARIHVDSSLVSMSGGDGPETLGTNVDNALAALEGLTGDAERGEALYSGTTDPAMGPRLGCAGCHNGGAIGPATMGTWSRTQNERLALADLSGYTVEEYLVESILRPNDYIVEGYASGVMLGIYGDQLSAQDMADILAYLEAQG